MCQSGTAENNALMVMKQVQGTFQIVRPGSQIQRS